MPICRTIVVLSCVLSWAGQPLAAQLMEQGLADGLAVITSRTRGVRIASPDTAARAPELHAVATLSELELTSGNGDSIFFALSNGIGLGVAENSQLRFKHYQQQPFSAGKESLDYEPSRSKLELQLLQGSLVFSAPQLSPLSEIVIQLPQGQVRIQRASGQVHYDEHGAHISIVSGIVTYAYPGKAEDAFIHAPNRVHISEQSALAGRIEASETITDDDAGRRLRKWVDAARHASQRVVFRVTGEQPAIPQPALVAQPGAWQQPSPRPYRYLD